MAKGYGYIMTNTAIRDSGKIEYVTDVEIRKK